jgi:hypothetical protein
MPICKESILTSLLKNLGYNAVLLPREGIVPLNILVKRQRKLNEVGTIGDLIKNTDRDLPRITSDLQTANFSKEWSSSVDVDAGIDFLSNIFSGLGIGIDKISLENAFKRTKKMSFSFEDVREDKIREIDLERYIVSGNVDPDSRVFKKKLFQDDLYVITSILKSKTFSVSSKTETDNEAKIDVPVIEQLLEGNLSVTTDTDKSSVMKCEGEKDLIFGFRAVQLIYDKNELADLKNTNIVMRSDVELKLLDSETGFVDPEPLEEDVE